MKSIFILNTDKAFSLLEIMVVILILAVGMVSIGQAFSKAARAALTSSDLLTAVIVMSNKIQEFELKENNIQDESNVPLESIDTDPSMGRHYIQQSTLSSIPDSQMLYLDMEINWQRSNKQHSLALATYIKGQAGKGGSFDE